MSELDNYNTVFLCGFMGTGKSTLGKIVARLLEKPFIDLDDVIVRDARLPIPRIFHLYGESYFRKLEKEALDNVIERSNGIVALGGGTLQNQEMVDYIKENGILVFIETPLEELWPRLIRKKHRPMLHTKDGQMKDDETLKKDLSELYHKRLPLYEQAHIKYTAHVDSNPNEQANELKDLIYEYDQTS